MRNGHFCGGRVNFVVENEFVVDPVIATENASRLHAYWQSKCGGRARPCWSDLDLMDI